MMDNKYKSWIKDAWIEAGGLITQKTASLISGLSEAQISRKVKDNKLRSWKYGDMKTPLVSYAEVMKLERERNIKQ